MKDLSIDSSYTIPKKVSDRIKKDTGAEKSFGQFLKASIEEVNRLQGEANHAIEELATGQTKNIHETMIALEKAEISFKLMLQVRNKIIEAYQEVMRMSV
jgi:flagellar hook-basal body complex protein FliE